jgi:phenylacetate-CoA ligase
VEARPGAAGTEIRAAMAGSVQQRVKEVIGVTVQCTVLEPYGIERSLGKARRIIDERPK